MTPDLSRFSEASKAIAKRQYFTGRGDENLHDMFTAVASWIASPEPQDKRAAYEKSFYELMASKRFSPGGRVLAGAATGHGNVLNCFVQDGSPEDVGSNAWVFEAARKLALTTRVGGGNGVFLGDIQPKRSHNLSIGRLYLALDESHPDYENFASGTFYDFESMVQHDDGTMKIGNYIKKGYYYAVPLSSNAPLPDDLSDPVRITVEDSTVGIWSAASEGATHLLQGRDVVLTLDNLRPEGAEVKGTHGVSSGPASFAVEVFDNFARYALLGGADYAGPVATLRYVFSPTLRVLRQAGVRRGAGMATINHDHADLDDFITCKDHDREAKEGNINTFNISVLVADHYMMSARTNPAHRDVLLKIADHAWQTGEPGVIFPGRINEYNPMRKTLGEIKATNPLRA